MKMKRIAAGILAFTLLMSCAVTTWAEGVGMYVTIPYLGSSENPTRYDLMYFIGSTFYCLDQETYTLSETKHSSSEIKWGDSTTSVTGTGSGTITRIRLDNGNRNYCVAGICPGMGTSDVGYMLDEKGFSFDKYVTKNGEEWTVCKNSSTKRFVAYHITYATVDTIYYGMEGYMPFG